MPGTPEATAVDSSEHKRTAVLEEEDKGGKREIGGDAVWTLSTAKPGNGVEQLRFSSPLSVLVSR